MAIKKLQQNYTTPEQSKRLLELGLPADSADCIYRCEDDDHIYVLYNNPFSKIQSLMGDIIPCWSVGRLIEIVDMCSVKQDYVGKFEFTMNKSYIQNLIYLIIEMLHTKDLDFQKLEE